MPQRILSISGLRGVIGDGLTPEYLTTFAAAFGTWAGGGTVILSRDGRGSGEMVRDAVCAGLVSVGCKVVDIGIASTPTCAVVVTEQGAEGGMQITASHNPSEWNGLKPFAPEGRILNADEGRRLLSILEQSAIEYQPWNKLGHVLSTTNTDQAHLDKVLQRVSSHRIREAGLRVMLDCNRGSGAVMGPRLLRELGCSVTVKGDIPDGRFEHTPEPTEENLVDFARSLRDEGADVGFAQDPDADRLAIVDENGHYIGEELTLALCLDHVLKHTPGPVVVNGSTSRVNADIARKYGCEFHRSFVGEAHVVARMQQVGAVIGGEGNGGIIDPKIGYVRDSFVGMALVLEGLAERGGTLSQWVDSLPVYHIVKDKLTCASEVVPSAIDAMKSHFADATATEGDGLRLDWDDRWVQLRASNTEPIVRIIAEAPEKGIARGLVEETKRLVEKAESGKRKADG